MPGTSSSSSRTTGSSAPRPSTSDPTPCPTRRSTSADRPAARRRPQGRSSRLRGQLTAPAARGSRRGSPVTSPHPPRA
jgi:hypothetical protein